MGKHLHMTNTARALAGLTALFLLVTGLLYRRDTAAAAADYTIGPTRAASEEALAPAFTPVDLNTADEETLSALTGIGPALARRIIDYRRENGPFPSIEEIMEVKGIGQSVFQQIQREITVGP